jgi:uncharacterized protein YxjI
LENTPYTLTLVQKLTMMKNQWTVQDERGVDLGVITQKRMSLKESVTCTTPDQSVVVFRIQGRKVLELAGTYDIADGDGGVIATISKDFKTSLGRSTYVIETGQGRFTLTEASELQAILRRLFTFVLDVPWLRRIQFALLDESGRTVGHVRRANMKITDTYEIRIEDPRIDTRVAAAMGVAVDAFMNR